MEITELRKDLLAIFGVNNRWVSQRLLCHISEMDYTVVNITCDIGSLVLRQHEFHEAISDSAVEVFSIFSFIHNKGHGTKLMQTVCDIADKHNIKLLVMPCPTIPGGKNKEELIIWNKTFGYVTCGAGYEKYMVRLPIKKS